MNYYFRSFWTRSYWGYALWSEDALKTFVAVVGGIWLFIDIFGALKIIDNQTLSLWYLAGLILIGFLAVIFTRRPVKRITCKCPGQDLKIEVLIGDLFDVVGQKIISTNTTFDTDLASGIISTKSVQGQFTEKYFPGNIHGLNDELEKGLKDIQFSEIQKEEGKIRRYDIGTTVKLQMAGEMFYWFAMADLNKTNNAKTSQHKVIQALEGLWDFIENQGEKQDIVIPLIGSGLGRLKTTRKRLIVIIAQSFLNASENNLFSNKLKIVIPPSDIDKSALNLFEVKDLLNNILR